MALDHSPKIHCVAIFDLRGMTIFFIEDHALCEISKLLAVYFQIRLSP
jgi:hypothetical protein